MTGVLVLIFFLLIGPLAILWGADSRSYDERDRRGWWPGDMPTRETGAVRSSAHHSHGSARPLAASPHWLTLMARAVARPH